MQEKYESYNSDQFLEDPLFIEWIRQQTPESEAFWSAWKADSPSNLEAMQEAEIKLRAMLSAKSINPEAEEAGQIWQRIENSISAKGKVISLKGSKIWMAAAATVLLVIISGLWFFTGRQGMKKGVIATTKVEDIAPGGNKAILTLADGSKVILDAANNGAITKQGNVTVIKLNDGQLAYQSSTLNGQSSTVEYNTITTPRGGQYQLVLADGSRVWLNAASSLRYPTSFTGSDRKVELTGEGYFEVAHDASHPFHVLVSPISGAINEVTDVQVLGTHFNVNAYDDENDLRATLLEGAVKVSRGAENVLISPNEQAVLKKVADKININKDVDVEAVVAWKNGLFQFGQADIQTVMRKIARWYDIDVEFQGNIPETLFAGKISRNSNVSTVLKVLAEGGIHFKIENKKIIVSP